MPSKKSVQEPLEEKRPLRYEGWLMPGRVHALTKIHQEPREFAEDGRIRKTTTHPFEIVVNRNTGNAAVGIFPERDRDYGVQSRAVQLNLTQSGFEGMTERFIAKGEFKFGGKKIVVWRADDAFHHDPEIPTDPKKLKAHTLEPHELRALQTLAKALHATLGDQALAMTVHYRQTSDPHYHVSKKGEFFTTKLPQPHLKFRVKDLVKAFDEHYT